MYKLIAMDFDGTLLTDDKKVSGKTLEKLQELKEEGYYIVGVTARNLESVKNVVSISLFDYLILNNGVYLYDVKQEMGKYIGKLEKETISEIIKLVEEKAKEIDLATGTFYYIYKNKKNSPLPFTIDIDSIDEILEDVARMNIFVQIQKDLDLIFQTVSTNFPDLNISFMQDSNAVEKWIIINPPGIDKSITLENLGKTLNIPLEEMIFFGDSLNDLAVMKKVGCGVAMKNALESVKQQATYITDSNNEDGIATFLSKYINH